MRGLVSDQSRQRHGLVAVTLLSAFFATACATAPAEPAVSDQTAREYRALVDSVIEDALAAGASDLQVEALENARAAGEMTRDEATESLHRFFDCLDSVGIGYIDRGPSGSGDYPRLEYLVEADEAHDALAADCYRLEYDFVDTVYQLQPQVGDMIDTRIAEGREELSACLADAGIDVAADATVEELTDALWLAWLGIDRKDPDALVDPNFEGVDCASAIGLSISDL